MADITFITPFFIVSDLQTSVSFYVDKLGFEIWHSGPPENPFWAMLGRDGVSVMLKAIAPGRAADSQLHTPCVGPLGRLRQYARTGSSVCSLSGTRGSFPPSFATYRRRLIRI